MTDASQVASPSARSRAFVALLLTAPAPSVGVITAMFIWPEAEYGFAPGPAIFLACKLWMLVLPIGWRLLVDRAPISLSPARYGGFGVGALLGVAIAIVILAAGFLLGPSLIDFDVAREMADQNGIGTIRNYLFAVAFWILVNSVLEEYVYRWFIFEKAEQIVSSRLAVIIAALIFTAHHVLALRAQFDWKTTLLGSLGVFIGGVAWSWLYLKYRSIWPAYLSHAIADVAVFTLGWWIIFGG